MVIKTFVEGVGSLESVMEPVWGSKAHIGSVLDAFWDLLAA